MAYLNLEALQMITEALHDHEDVCERLMTDISLPPRLQREYSAKRHMARTLAELFESHPAFDAENVPTEDYRALIWDHTPTITLKHKMMKADS